MDKQEYLLGMPHSWSLLHIGRNASTKKKEKKKTLLV